MRLVDHNGCVWGPLRRCLLATTSLCVLGAASMPASHAQLRVYPPDNQGDLDLSGPNFPAFQLIVPGGDAEESGKITGGSGLGVLYKLGAGNLTLTGANDYFAQTWIFQGGLIAGTSTAFGTGVISMFNGSLLGYRDGVTIANEVGIVAPGGIVTLDVATGRAVQAGSVQSPFGGTMIKSGAGTLALTNLNLSQIHYRLDAGTLEIGHAQALGLGGNVTMNGGALRSTVDATLSNSLIFAGGQTGTVSAAAGTTVTFGPNGGLSFFELQAGSTAIFGTPADSGTIVVASDIGTAFGDPNVVVAGGTLRAESNALGLLGFINSTTVNAGATLDFNDQPATVNNLQGAGIVNIGANPASVLLLSSVGPSSVFSGAITGAGGVVIGTGTVTLSGANSYAGETRIANDATLQLGSGGAGGSILGNVTFLPGIGTPGQLIFDRSDAHTFAGAISGTGSVVKNGAGATTLTGDSTYTGPTTVNAGALVVNGSITSVVDVNNSALLGGTGSVGGLNVAGGATLAPGNSIGTLTVNGDATIAAGSTYQVEVNAAGQSDLLAVTGTANINGGTVQVLAANGNYAPQTRYTILTANGGVTGTFANVTDNFVFLDPSLSYTPTSVLLTMSRVAMFASVAQTPNQRSVANALDQFPTSNPLFLSALNQTASGARQAFDALSGEVHATAPGVLLDESRYVRNAVLGRLRQAPYEDSTGAMAALGAGGPDRALAGVYAADLPVKAPPLVPARPSGLTFWADGFGAWGTFDGNGNAASADRRLGGVLLGVDGRLADSWRLGFAAGYSHSSIDVNARASSANVDTGHVALYGGGSFGPWSLRAGAAYAHHQIDTTRSVVFPGFLDRVRADYDGSTAQVFGEIGYGMMFGRVAVEPFAGLAWARIETDSFAEVGGSAALNGLGVEEDTGYSTLGVRFATHYALANGMTLTPRISAAWQHAFDDLTPGAALAFRSTGIGFGIAGVPLAQDSALIDAGLDLRVTPQATLGVSYVGQLASDVEDHAVKGRVVWRF